MGYYTEFNINIHEAPADTTLTIELLEDELAELGYQFVRDLDGSLTSDDPYKWYNCDQNVADITIKYPGVVIKVHGKGDDSGDLWDAYYKDGNMQLCRMIPTYPPYDPALLTSVEEAENNDPWRNEMV